MEKKNPYVMTIGFRRNNADHTRVAEFLNSLGREKAQYIVKAVLTYRTLEEKGEVPQTGGAVQCPMIMKQSKALCYRSCVSRG